MNGFDHRPRTHITADEFDRELKQLRHDLKELDGELAAAVAAFIRAVWR